MIDRRYLFIIAIATLITIVIWVTSDVYHARSQVEISPKLQRVIEPISPNFDQSAIQLLEQ